MRTFGQIKASVYEDLGYTSSPPTDVQNRIAKNINYAHDLILRDPICQVLRDTTDTITFATQADRDIYALPGIVEVRCLTERDTQRRLWPISLEEARTADPGRTADGTPWGFINKGYHPLVRPFAFGGGPLYAVSSAAGDTTQTVTATGFRADGTVFQSQVVLTGTTRVLVSPFVWDLSSLVLSAAAVGLISFYDAAVAGNLMSEIAIGETAVSYRIIQLFPMPTDAITYYVDGQYRIQRLTVDAQVPLVPEAFQTLLEDYARYKEYEKLKDDRLPYAFEAWQTGLTQLKARINSQPGFVPTFGRREPRFSRFGPWAPADDRSGW